MTGLTMKYFVLSPNKQDEYGEASRRAMITYANSIRPTNPQLAQDLTAWVVRIEDDRREA